MKRFLSTLCALLVAISFAGCEQNDFMIWDLVNPSVCFFITDAETGANLCDPSVEGNVLDWNVTATTDDGETFELIEDDPFTRATLAEPLALRLTQYSTLGNIKGWHVSFGEWDPYDGFRNKKFTINWGDGTQTEVEFNLFISKMRKRDIKIDSSIWVDGEDHGNGYYDGWIINIKK